MFKALSAICSGFRTRSIARKKRFSTVGTGYVDNVMLMVTTKFKEEQTEKQVNRKIKSMARTWEKLLYITGGKLELSKCFWIPIMWQWKKGQIVMKSRNRESTESTLTELETGKKITIKKIIQIGRAHV